MHKNTRYFWIYKVQFIWGAWNFKKSHRFRSHAKIGHRVMTLSQRTAEYAHPLRQNQLSVYMTLFLWPTYPRKLWRVSTNLRNRKFFPSNTKTEFTSPVNISGKKTTAEWLLSPAPPKTSSGCSPTTPSCHWEEACEVGSCLHTQADGL